MRMGTAATHTKPLDFSFGNTGILSTSAAFVGPHFTVHPTFHDMNHEGEHCSIQHPISINMLHVQIQDTFRRPSLLRCCGQNLGKIHFRTQYFYPSNYLSLHTVRISTNASKHPSSIHRQIDKSYIQTESPFLVKPSDLCDLHRKGTVKVASSTLQFWFPAILKRQTLVNLTTLTNKTMSKLKSF